LEVTIKIIAAWLQQVMLPTKMFSAKLVGFEIRFLNQIPKDGRFPVNKFRAQFDNFVTDGATENSASHSIPRFHHVDTQSCGCQLPRRSQACDSSAQHDDIVACFRHG
jgi:hypothetical protein